jgi:hypothetical protein
LSLPILLVFLTHGFIGPIKYLGTATKRDLQLRVFP